MALLKNGTAKGGSAQSVSVRYSALVKRVERLLEEVPSSDEVDETVRGLVEHASAALQEELGFTGGRLYKRFEQDFHLLTSFGGAQPPADPPDLPATYAPVDRVCAEGMVYFDRDDPRLDRELEDALGVEEFAAIEVGDEAYLVAFDLVAGLDREEVLISLGILRQIINQRIRQERTEDVFREARRIQASILPRRVPSYGSYDLAGRNDSLDEVGGDFYDYIPISEKILGLTIADVTGSVAPKGSDGQSFLPLVKGDPSNARGWIFQSYSKNGPGTAPFRCFVRDADWKLYADGSLFNVPNDWLEESPVTGPRGKAARQRLQPILDGILKQMPSKLIDRRETQARNRKAS